MLIAVIIVRISIALLIAEGGLIRVSSIIRSEIPTDRYAVNGF